MTDWIGTGDGYLFKGWKLCTNESVGGGWLCISNRKMWHWLPWPILRLFNQRRSKNLDWGFILSLTIKIFR